MVWLATETNVSHSELASPDVQRRLYALYAPCSIVPQNVVQLIGASSVQDHDDLMGLAYFSSVPQMTSHNFEVTPNLESASAISSITKRGRFYLPKLKILIVMCQVVLLQVAHVGRQLVMMQPVMRAVVADVAEDPT